MELSFEFQLCHCCADFGVVYTFELVTQPSENCCVAENRELKQSNNTSTDLPPSFNSYCPASLCHITITEADVYEALVSLDTSKAMGPDGIPPILLSKCASVLYKPLHYLFNLTLKFGYLPCEWKVHKIIPVFKSGDPTHINNY